jgi:hypothetical protein
LSTGLNGVVNADSSIAAGTGFTVVHNGVGDYSVNFTAPSPFASPPIVTFTPLTMFAGGIMYGLSGAPTVNGFRVIIKTAAGANTDVAFNFSAEAQTV